MNLGSAVAVTIAAGMTTRRSPFKTDSNTATRSVPLQYPSKTTLTGVPIESLGFEKSTGPSEHLEVSSSITQTGTGAACSPNCTM
jgi:hypothetical protein